MRQIKFRAWDKENRVMFYSEDNQNDDFTFISEKRGLQFYYIDKSDRYLQDTNSVLMQYSGLKDKCGREIYEGDIVNTLDGKGKVIFEQLISSFAIEYSISKIALPDYLAQQNARLEVIGNIYEDKHLLEGDSNA